jgi:site-specific DNA-adenine methylase
LFRKQPTEFEVWNDFNSNLTNLYRCVRDCPEELIKKLEFTLNSREDFDRIRLLLKRLAAALQRAEGKWLLSYNDCDEVRGLYNWPGVMMEPIVRLSNIAQRYENGKEFPELLISNYDTTERARQHVQLSLFDCDFCAGLLP